MARSRDAGRFAAEDPETVLTNRRARRERHVRRIRAKLDALKANPCVDCGVSYPPYVMDFDHRDPTLKLKSVGAMALSASWKAIEAEIAKCDLVCANCHRERTYGA